MKSFLSTALALACVLLIIAMMVVKQGDNARHQTDTGTITDYSNRLDAAQTQLAIYTGMSIDLSNRLDQCHAASLTVSNQLTVTIAGDEEQITNLNQQVAALTTENQALNQHIVNLTNQVAGLNQQIAQTKASLTQTGQDLAQAHKDYALLENRLRRDVAERVIVERRFNNPSELQAQLDHLKTNPAREISADSMLAGLDIEVNSNGTFHVLASE
jgi:chromosome segregation ATPase